MLREFRHEFEKIFKEFRDLARSLIAGFACQTGPVALRRGGLRLHPAAAAVVAGIASGQDR
ncbi:hypothetical protein BA177_00705 [Woeseia oceani]|uniref:Uncharacterized protein n=1 Tax=Woeseia oceani TaxID=1548547 RepID=A0A193LBQ1_9GAMM|nr:hypothetical protein BA177_00705 [Woeseia oceani]